MKNNLKKILSLFCCLNLLGISQRPGTCTFFVRVPESSEVSPIMLAPGSAWAPSIYIPVMRVLGHKEELSALRDQRVQELGKENVFVLEMHDGDRLDPLLLEQALQAKHILVTAQGVEESFRLLSLAFGSVNPHSNISRLLYHPNVEFLVDQSASLHLKAFHDRKVKDPLLSEWLKMWQHFWGISGEWKINHQIYLYIDFNKKLRISGELVIEIEQQGEVKKVVELDYTARPKGVLEIMEHEINEEESDLFGRKKLMTLLHLYLFNRYQIQERKFVSLEMPGKKLVRAHEKVGLLKDVVIIGGREIL